MLVNYYLPGNMSAPPPALLVYGHSGRTMEEQSLLDPLSYDKKHFNMYYGNTHTYHTLYY